MRALINLAIIVAIATAGMNTWNKFEAQYAPKALASARTSVDQLNNSITNAVSKTNNPFQAEAKAQEAVNTKSNATPTVIIRQKDCAGMDCYKDMTTEIPVIVASNINN